MILNMSHSESDTREVAERAAQADLVILSQTTPAGVSSFAISRSDHRGLLTTLAGVR